MTSPCVAVAVSGGRDSLSLLHATLLQAQPLGLRVVALHVHHGLQPAADAWVAQIRSCCERWAQTIAPVEFHWRRLAGKPEPGDSVEAWARRGRYAALGDMAQETGASLLLLGHHQRDQAETFVLQALRGGGARGLSAMPKAIERDGVVWARPWLAMPREAIEAYAERHGLPHVDDPSNAESRFARNRLRQQVWPALTAAFPDAQARLAGAASHAQWEAACLEEWGAIDLAAVQDAQGELVIEPWQALSPARRRNALRRWLRERLGRGADEALIDRLMAQVTEGEEPALWQAGEQVLRRYRGVLHCRPATRCLAMPDAQAIDLSQPGVHALPAWGGSFEVCETHEDGVAVSRLQTAVLRARQGGEQFQAHARSIPRALKKQYQSAGVAAWARNGPLLYCEERLVFVPGLGIDARARAEAGVSQVNLRWIPDA